VESRRPQHRLWYIESTLPESLRRAFVQEQAGSAFVPCRRADLENIFCLQWQRSVNRDNTVSFENLHLQIEPVRWRCSHPGL
jgi:hypothetical protein